MKLSLTLVVALLAQALASISLAGEGPENALRSYFDALRKADRATANELTARFSKFTETHIAATTDWGISLGKNRQWRPVISKSKTIDNCAVVVMHESSTDPDPAYLIQQNGAWRVLPKLTQYNRDVFELPPVTLKNFQELDEWYQVQVGKRVSTGKNPFDEDVITKREELARHLDGGFDVNARSLDDYKETLLMRAVKRRAEDSVKLLLERGAKVDERSLTLRKTALFFAAYESSEAIVRMLLEKGADPNALDWIGNNPLREASAAKRAGMVRLLLQHGARLSQTNKDGESMKDIALKYGGPKVREVIESESLK
ncbi:MAG TPA: ankyrin repeat domain-containing protein [Methylomirabilota bacterium]|nr:ankyrin repeat domain-containing protein [Methylomirabilota bacterium]